jgi:NTP pyrophosphatase (non-canonical NTP hydrolase)
MDKTVREELEKLEGVAPEAIYKFVRLQLAVNNDVLKERRRQNELWGIQRRPLGQWLAILAEEFGEVAQAMQPLMGIASTKETDADDLYEELIQLAAVASAVAEHVREVRGVS